MLPLRTKYGLDPQTVHYVVSDCPRYAAARSVSPRFDFDDQSNRLALSSVYPEYYGMVFEPTRDFIS